MISISLTFKEKSKIFFSGFWAYLIPLALLMGPVLHFAAGGPDGLYDLQFSFREVVKTRGFVTEIYETSQTVDDYEVYRFEYTFPIGLETFYGESYSSEFDLTIGQNVPVEYIVSNPSLSRITGSTASLNGTFALVGIIITIIAIILTPIRFRKVLTIQHLLLDASITNGKLTETQETNITINDDPLYELTYLYTINDQPFYHYHRTTNPDDMTKDIEVIYGNRDYNLSAILEELPHAIIEKVQKHRDSKNSL